MVRAPHAFSIRPGLAEEMAREGDIAQLFATNPDGFLVAEGIEGSPRGEVACLVRDDVLVLAHLEVREDRRGAGVGTALLSAAKEFGRSRGARSLELLAPDEPEVLGFFLKRGLAMKSAVFALGAAVRDIAVEEGRGAADVSFAPLAEGAGLSGWVASLDRETRGFARTSEWTWWLRTRTAEVWSLKRRGRPEGIAAMRTAGDIVLLGPVETRLPAWSALALSHLASRARTSSAARVLALVPAEARLVLAAAFSSGLRLERTHVLFGSKSRGDLRRYAGSGSLFF